MKREQAETVALQALAFLGEDERMLSGFLAQSGCGPTEIRQRLNDAAFLGGVLDFLLSDEALLLRFCQANELRPEIPARARRALPGMMEWG